MFDFPSSPTADQVYGNYKWNGYAWVPQSSGGGGGASVTVADTPPPSPSNGDLWMESDSGTLYMSYSDGSSVQWLDVSGGSSQSWVQISRLLTISFAAQPQHALCGGRMKLNDADKIYIGGAEAQAVYAGSTLVWPAGGVDWSPTELPGLIGWFNYDPGNFTQASGGIATVTDLSGSGHHLTAVAPGTSITYSATGANGRPTAMFNGIGSGNALVCNSFAIGTGKSFAAYVVGAMTGAQAYASAVTYTYRRFI